MALIAWSDFVVWQCSLRQRNFRIFSGKPSEGTIALILLSITRIFPSILGCHFFL